MRPGPVGRVSSCRVLRDPYTLPPMTDPLVSAYLTGFLVGMIVGLVLGYAVIPPVVDAWIALRRRSVQQRLRRRGE